MIPLFYPLLRRGSYFSGDFASGDRYLVKGDQLICLLTFHYFSVYVLGRGVVTGSLKILRFILSQKWLKMYDPAKSLYM